jgi:hypothetical protein
MCEGRGSMPSHPFSISENEFVMTLLIIVDCCFVFIFSRFFVVFDLPVMSLWVSVYLFGLPFCNRVFSFHSFGREGE